MKLKNELFANRSELLTFVNGHNIQKENIQCILLRPSGYYDLFYWE